MPDLERHVFMYETEGGKVIDLSGDLELRIKAYDRDTKHVLSVDVLLSQLVAGALQAVGVAKG